MFVYLFKKMSIHFYFFKTYGTCCTKGNLSRFKSTLKKRGGLQFDCFRFVYVG